MWKSIRNTPFIVQLFFIFFGLPGGGDNAVRDHGGVPRHDDQSRRLFDRDHPRRHRRRCPRDISRPATASPCRACEVLRYIVLKQAFQKIYPALSSQIIIVMLGSAVVSQISAEDLTYAGRTSSSRAISAPSKSIWSSPCSIFCSSIVARAILRGIGRYAFPKA